MELTVKNLSKTYASGVQALKKINLTVFEGMFGLLGPNGAGKSTLMRTIATLQKADEGTILLNGMDVLREKDKVRQILGYLPQEFGLYHDVTAERMLTHIARLKGISSPRERKDTVRHILDQSNLFEYRKRKLSQFSGGMKQRFGIAQALIANPRLIIVDEPTAGLDPEERNRFLNMLGEISENVVVILSTHIVDDVRELCSQMAIIHEGEVLMSGSPDSAIQALSGKVWEKKIKKAELPGYSEQYNIIFTRMYGENILIHVLNDTSPESGFDPIRPDLDDVYFSTIRN